MLAYLRETDGQNPLLLELDKYGTTRPAYVVRYHADYMAALEAATDAKIAAATSGPTGPSANVFVYGGAIDINGIDATTYGPLAITPYLLVSPDNYASGPNVLDQGRYYRIVDSSEVPTNNRVKIVVDSLDSIGVIVKPGDAVIVRDATSGETSYKALDLVDNTVPQISSLNSAITAVVQPDGTYQLDLSAEASGALTSGANLPNIQTDINTALNTIFNRLQTVTRFIGYMESTGTLLDAFGYPTTFAQDMAIKASPLETLTGNSVAFFPSSTYDLHVAEGTSGNYTISVTMDNLLNTTFDVTHVDATDNSTMLYNIVTSTGTFAAMKTGTNNGTLTFSQSGGTGPYLADATGQLDAAGIYTLVVYESTNSKTHQIKTFNAAELIAPINETTFGTWASTNFTVTIASISNPFGTTPNVKYYIKYSNTTTEMTIGASTLSANIVLVDPGLGTSVELQVLAVHSGITYQSAVQTIAYNA